MMGRPAPRGRQGGIALLLTLLVLFMATTYVFYRQANIRLNRSGSDAATAAALARARDALIAWSASHPTTPGLLPCPEDTDKIGTANEGQAKASCANTQPSVGRLPWRSLGIEQLTDADGEPLWYALSPGFRNPPINSNSTGQLTVDGQVPGAVAIVFSPGVALPGQTRNVPSAAAPPDITQYLDGTNADGDTGFTALPVAGAMNDQLLPISPADLFRAVEKRVAREVRYALLEYYCGLSNVSPNGGCVGPALNGFFPRPAQFSDLSCVSAGGNCLSLPPVCQSGLVNNEGRIPRCPTEPWSVSSLLFNQGLWFHKNGWRELVYYAVAPACTDGTSGCNGTGFLTVQQPGGANQTTIQVTVIVAGAYLGSGGRNATVVADYLEEQNASTNDKTFTRWPTTTIPFNDQTVTIP